jgi:hypothetical protein
VPQHLFIVDRKQPNLFSYLAREFSGEPEVTVILDRRLGERRRSPRPGASAARRQSDRRSKRESLSQLATLGYAFVRVS